MNKAQIDKLVGPAVVIGSPASASDGRYQQVITTLAGRPSERQMLDRLLDGAAKLSPNRFSSAHLVLSPQDYATLNPSRLKELLKIVSASLQPAGILFISNLPEHHHSLISAPDFTLLSHSTPSDLTIATKSSPAAVDSFKSSKSMSLPLPRRSKQLDPSINQSKKALWAFGPSSTAVIDAESLLNASDLERPSTNCGPMTGEASRRRKRACKGCTCGLAEIEAADKGRIVYMSGSDEGRTLANEGMKAATSVQTTSSCGSCYLGDAFRCASCPYQGMPAFQPGEVVQIDMGMDDI